MRKKNIEESAVKLYDYLLEHHLGEENGIKRDDLALKFHLDKRTLRHLTKFINSDSRFEKLISTKSSCYVCNTRQECEQTLRNTYNFAIALFMKANTMKRKVGLNNQFKMKVDKDELKDIVETFEE
jgi:hypothetical protein